MVNKARIYVLTGSEFLAVLCGVKRLNLPGDARVEGIHWDGHKVGLRVNSETFPLVNPHEPIPVTPAWLEGANG